MNDLKSFILNKNFYTFLAIFLLSYTTLITFGYALIKGHFVSMILIKFYLVDMIFVSLFMAMGGGIWQNKKAFYAKFAILSFILLIPFIVKTTIKEIPIFSTELSLNIAFFIFLAYFLLFIFVAAKFTILRILLFIFIALPGFIFLVYFSQTKGFLNEFSIIAMLETNPSEAEEYIKTNLNIYLPLIILLFIFIGFLFLKNFNQVKILKINSKIILRILFLFSLMIFYFSRMNFENLNIYTPIYRESKLYLTALDNFTKNEKERISSIKNLKFKDENALYVLVIGESQNKNFMSVYGYNKPTTPFLNEFRKNQNTIFFENAFSNHTLTIQTLYQSMTTKNQYNQIPQEMAPSLIELANLASFETIYISNQAQFGIYGSPLSALFSSANQKIYLTKQGITGIIGYDERILPEIDKVNFAPKTLLILHLMGAHWQYDARYPQNFAKFESKYDNAIFYNDFVIRQIYKKVSKMPNFKALVYCSDHGENMKFQHDQNALFTFDMVQIPFFAYFSDEYISQNSQIFANLKAHKNDFWTNDLFFNFMSGIMNLHSSIDEPQNDISSEFYDTNKSRFKTLHGKKKIIDYLD